MPTQQPPRKKRTVPRRRKTVKPVPAATLQPNTVELKSPIVLAGIIVFALAAAVALWTLADSPVAYSAVSPVHRDARVAGALAEFTPGPVTLAVADGASQALFVVDLDEPLSLYQLLLLASDRTGMRLAWGVGKNGGTALRQIGPLVASDGRTITAALSGAVLSLDDILDGPNTTITFALTDE